jgi:tRNA nucleotidyltransferase (CCA-adding enzyme)
LRLTLNAPPAVREISERLEKAGYSTWAVGGAVRDAVLGAAAPGRQLPSDWDLATSALPEQVRALFKRTVPIGIEHGTVGVLARDGVLYEITTFRRDIETTGRHAVVEFADTIDEDLARRDFTFNAIAWHPLREELIDPFGGLEDLRSGILRTVGDPAERFAEDYLRILRALRFGGHFVLRIDTPTWDALVAATPHLADLSAERVREEFWKIFSKTRHASAALKLYASSGALAVVIPELVALRELYLQPGAELDAWQQSIAAVDALPTSRPLLRMTALLHKVGLPAARSQDLRGGERFTGHEPLGARKAEAIMRRLKASNAEVERLTELVEKQSMLPPPDAPPSGLRRWLLHVPPALINDLFRLRFAIWRAHPTSGGDRELAERWRKVHALLNSHPVIDTSGLAIDGRDLKGLGFEPGPRFGEILRALLDRVIEQPELNTREALLAIVREDMAE